jgi:predicted CopG family antitoxin
MNKQTFTTIQVTQEIWAELNKRKKDSSETFVDVLIKVLGIEKGNQINGI